MESFFIITMECGKINQNITGKGTGFFVKNLLTKMIPGCIIIAKLPVT